MGRVVVNHQRTASFHKWVKRKICGRFKVAQKLRGTVFKFTSIDFCAIRFVFLWDMEDRFRISIKGIVHPKITLLSACIDPGVFLKPKPNQKCILRNYISIYNQDENKWYGETLQNLTQKLKLLILMKL